jgi:hypothetical protein
MKLLPPDKFPSITPQARQAASDRAVPQSVFAATKEERLCHPEVNQRLETD